MKPSTKTTKSSILQELVFEIFSWLPTKSLMHFKCSFKIYSSLVLKSAFMDAHHFRSIIHTIEKKFFIWQNKIFYTTGEKKEGKASRLHIENFSENRLYDHIMCVSGLFFCLMKYVECVAICNSNIKVVTYLLRLKVFAKIGYPRYFFAMGFDQDEKRYKVLIIVKEYSWVFTLGTDKS